MSSRVLNPNNVTVDANINDAEVAFAGATYTPDFSFPTAVSSSTPSKSPTVSAASDSGDLSTSSKAGIGVGLAALLVILIGVCVLMRKRRRTKRDAGTHTQYQYPPSYPLKDLEASVSHEELIANAAKPAHGPIKEFTPNVSVYSLNRDVKETSI